MVIFCAQTSLHILAFSEAFFSKYINTEKLMHFFHAIYATQYALSRIFFNYLL